MAQPAARNEDFNISTAESTTVARAGRGDLAQDQGRRAAVARVSDPAFEHDVQRRVPDVDQGPGGPRLRGTTSLDEMLDEVIPWVTQAVDDGRI